MPQSDENISKYQFVKNADGQNTSAGENQSEANFFKLLNHDFRIIFERDPAARNWLEVLFCYPGFHALCLHRLAHWLYHRKIGLIPRLISHFARFISGIEIHPAAKIGKGVFIDHGMVFVIVDTAIF